MTTFGDTDGATAPVGAALGAHRSPPRTADASARRRLPWARRRSPWAWRRLPWAWLAHTDALGPAIVVALIIALVVCSGIVDYRGNATGFIQLGRVFTPYTQPPPGAVIRAGTGYDGQFFWVMAQDPLLLHAHTLSGLAGQDFRLQRVAYPALAYVLAGGHAGAIPWTLLAVNVGVILLSALGFSRYARRRGWSGWWALSVALLPGFEFALQADLSDALAVVTMLGGLIAGREERRWGAAALLTVAVLAREPMMLALAAIFIQAAGSAWRTRRRPGSRRALARQLWPGAVVPAAAFAGWQLYIHLRCGGSTSAPGTAFSPPFAAIVQEVQRAIHQASPIVGVWDMCYLALMLAGMGWALVAVRRDRSAPAIAAALFSLILVVLVFGDAISYTRLSAPLWACLLLSGLERRSRGVLAMCAAVAALGAVLPLGIG